MPPAAAMTALGCSGQLFLHSPSRVANTRSSAPPGKRPRGPLARPVRADASLPRKAACIRYPAWPSTGMDGLPLSRLFSAACTSPTIRFSSTGIPRKPGDRLQGRRAWRRPRRCAHANSGTPGAPMSYPRSPLPGGKHTRLPEQERAGRESCVVFRLRPETATGHDRTIRWCPADSRAERTMKPEWDM